MVDLHGKFVWYELMTTDTAAAIGLYESVVGWTATDSGLPGMPYIFLQAGASRVGGLMALPAEAVQGGMRPGWLADVWVDDVDASTANAADLGGAVHRGPAEIPAVGRFAAIADPQGAMFAVVMPPLG